MTNPVEDSSSASITLSPRHSSAKGRTSLLTLLAMVILLVFLSKAAIDHHLIHADNNFLEPTKVSNARVDAQRKANFMEVPVVETTTTARTVKKSNSGENELPCNKIEGMTGFYARADAMKVIAQFVKKQTEGGHKPRFVPVMNELMADARAQNKTILTLQLGGMDGKTGDPMYRMTEFQSDLHNWEPVVIEPVPFNFKNLKATYHNHQGKKELPCPHIMNELINYDKSLESSEGICNFCHFDFDITDDENCLRKPNWYKFETGSMLCDTNKECFTKSTFPCGGIDELLKGIGFSAADVTILQVDVEGFEEYLLPAFFDEIPKESLPPVLNFESRVVAQRGRLDWLLDMLKGKGYGNHVKRVDTLSLLGSQGLSNHLSKQ